MGHEFPKTARVRHRREFLAIQRGSQRIHTPHYVVLLKRRGDDDLARLGLVTSRKVANAVGRNRVRRLLREVFRRHRADLPVGIDLVVIAREGAADLAIAQVRDEILGALARRRTGPSPAATPEPGGRPAS